jgi:hypothetical protein
MVLSGGCFFMPGKLLLIAASLLVSGCATVEQKALDSGAFGVPGGQTLQKSLHEPADFRSMTPASALTGGIAGATAAVLHGNDIVRHYEVEDPAHEIAGTVAAGLSSRYGLKMLPEVSTLSASDDPADLKTMHPSADYLLDIKTSVWGFAFFPADWNNYHVLYRARMRFVRMSDLAVLAEEECYYKPEYRDTNAAPTYDDLLDDNARGLKAELQNAVAFCASLFNKNLLG